MEMLKLIQMLTICGIPFEMRKHPAGTNYQVFYPSIVAQVCDVVCEDFTYGGTEGLLETMGLVDESVGDDVEGWLTAEEMFIKIRDHYINEKSRLMNLEVK